MMTTANSYRVENDQSREVQRRDLDIEIKLQDLQKMFLPGSDPYNKVQDIINQLKK